VAQRVEVNRPAALVSLGDAGRGEVPVEYLHEVPRHREQRLIEGQGERDRPADERRILPRCLKLPLDPLVQVLREVGPERDVRPPPGLRAKASRPRS
jgi:hypothetical protein